MAALRAAIVGAGLMGRWHAAYAARAGVRVAAVVDRDPAAGAALAGRFGATAYPDLVGCLAAEPVEAVHVCTGLDSHAALAGAALSAGRHVMLEKPAARTAAETAGLLAAAAAADRRLAVVHQFPFQRGFRRLAAALPRLGRLVRVVFTTFTAGGEGRDGPGRRAVQAEILPHPYSLLRALPGIDPDRADWSVVRRTDDALEIAGTSAAGVALGVVIDLGGRPTRNELLVVGEAGSAAADLFHGYSVFDPGRVSRFDKILRPFRSGGRLLWAAGTNLLGRAVRREPAYPGLRELTAAFYRAVRTGGPSPTPPDEIAGAAAFADRLLG
jgi:predicted dehydrogenase